MSDTTNPLDLKCPSCGALPGATCVGAFPYTPGAPAGVHAARRSPPAVECPSCGAGAGERCKRASDISHTARRPLPRPAEITEAQSAKLHQYIQARDDAVAWAQIAGAFVQESEAHDCALSECFASMNRAARLRKELNLD